ncbi:hypothetical protein Tco_0720923 [Tanacetum coccineum]
MILEKWCLGSGNGGVFVVVCGGESSGDMVVSGGLKGCLDHWILRSSPILPPLPLDLGTVSEHIPREDKTCVPVSSYELSTLNSASNVVLEEN